MAAPSPARRPPPPPPPESAIPPSPTSEPAFVPPALPGLYKRGDAIGDSYRVNQVLGEGGFGIVYLVQTRRGGGRVALKTIRDEWLRDDATRAMFRKEAELWIALGRHPYLVRADIGRRARATVPGDGVRGPGRARHDRFAGPSRA